MFPLRSGHEGTLLPSCPLFLALFLSRSDGCQLQWCERSSAEGRWEGTEGGLGPTGGKGPRPAVSHANELGGEASLGQAFP